MSVCNNQSFAYRPEIDGLRAFAVLPVIFFHAGFGLFPGGYVGVDVFFVISGYLITSIVLREIDEGKFSLIKFYERRARRILPALFFVILCCLPVAWILMAPGELKRFGQSIVAVTLFASNIFFWKTTDYFSPNSEEELLLHTWSLAVEEQFYLIFPVLLILGQFLGKVRLVIILVLITVVSICFAEWGWRNMPAANFYLLPARAWELLLGSLVAFFPRFLFDFRKNNALLSNFLGISGVGLILYSIFCFNSSTPFPSLFTLVPVIGAVMIISFCSVDNFGGKILSHPYPVFIGLISYSAYLWHQPLLAFIRLSGFDLSGFISLLVVGVTLLLAFITMKFVENPFRKGFILGKINFSVNASFYTYNKPVFIFSGIALISLLILGVFINTTDGLADEETRKRLKSLEQSTLSKQTDCHIYGEKVNLENYVCNLGSDNGDDELLFIGDSHLSMILEPLSELAESKNVSLLSLSSGYCIPGVELKNTADNRQDIRCERIVKESFDLIEKRGITKVGIFSRYAPLTEATYRGGKNIYFISGGVDKFEIADNSLNEDKIIQYNIKNACTALENTIIKLEELGVKKVVIGGPTPEVGRNFQVGLNNYLRNSKIRPVSDLTLVKFLENNSRIFQCLESVKKSYPIVTIFYPHLFFINREGKIPRFNLVTDEGKPIFSDNNHMYSYGSKSIASEFIHLLR